jgi:hypothetical protein
MQKDSKMISLGGTVLHLPTQVYFEVKRKRKNKQTGEVTLWDGQTPYPAAECLPDERERPLDETDLFTLQSMVAAMIDSGDFSDMDLFKALNQQQKGQLWAVLTQEQRDALKAAGKPKQEVAA